MFSKKTAAAENRAGERSLGDNTDVARNVQGMSMFGQGCSFEGTAYLQGHARISGHVKGTIVSSHILHVEETAQIDGTLQGFNIEVSGEVEGEIIAKELLRLTPRARVRGKITAAKLIVDEGAYLDGQVETARQQPPQEKRSKPAMANEDILKAG